MLINIFALLFAWTALFGFALLISRLKSRGQPLSRGDYIFAAVFAGITTAAVAINEKPWAETPTSAPTSQQTP